MYRAFAPIIVAFALLAADESVAADRLTIAPERIFLRAPEESQQLLVSVGDGDYTRDAACAFDDPTIARIDARGLVEPVRDGATVLTVKLGDSSAKVPVDVTGIADPPPLSFEHDILPVLTKSRCNSGGCHGKAEGKNGFKLSVFGFDPQADYDALTRDGRQRRIFPPSPENSLLIQKGTAGIPHGGGKKLEPGSIAHRRLVRWIVEGAPRTGQTAPVTGIIVSPEQRTLRAGESQQLLVTAVHADGVRRCVTAEAEYESNAATIAEVDGAGLVTAHEAPGEAAILVRYMGHVAVFRATHPKLETPFSRPPEETFVDTLVWDRLQRLGIEPSDVADDATFLRRAFLDVIGTLPTEDESRRFLTDSSPGKRNALVDELLNREEYADYWSMLWSDLLRVDRDKLTAQGAVAMTRWLREQFARNTPYDEFARDVVTAQGDSYSPGAAGFFAVMDSPEEAARSTSQLFLGVRIECAQCHHHPSDRWGQEDYYAFAGFFTGVKRKSLPNGNPAIVSMGGSDLAHPRTGAMMAACALGETPAPLSDIPDRRTALADWMTSPENPYFARAIANRLWAHYFGRGLAEPIDDLRATNPPTNEPLLDALAKHVHEVDFDLKAFTRTILQSRVYQLSSAATESNADDEQNFSHAFERPLPAEVLLDAISQATGIPEEFNGWPAGTRAIEIWDNRLPSYFFQIFGRPVRASVCECERSNEPSIAQALHLVNSPEILARIQSREGRAAALAGSELTAGAIVDSLCLTALSRFPNDEERALLIGAFNAPDRRAAAEDVLWTLLNSKEFLYNH